MNDSSLALVDMDSTLCDYVGTLHKKLNQLAGTIAGRELSIHADECQDLVDLIKKQPGFWRELPPIDLGFQIVNMLSVAKFDIHILTKGPYRTTSAWTEKVEWCRKHMPGTPVTITEHKGMMYGKVLVDDWPLYCQAWLKWRPRGLVIMPAFDYNEGFDKLYPGQVIRATSSNMDELEAAIQVAAEREAGEPLNV